MTKPYQSIIQNTYQQLNHLETMYQNNPDFNQFSLQINTLSCLNQFFKQVKTQIKSPTISDIINDVSVLHQNRNNIIDIVNQIKQHFQILLNESNPA